MQQDFQAAQQRINAKLAKVNTQFANEFPGLQAEQQVDYWPETLGEAEQRDSLNYKFKSTCPAHAPLREAMRAAIAEGGLPDYEVMMSTGGH